MIWFDFIIVKFIYNFMFKIFSKKLFSNNNLKEFYGNSLIKTKENIENLKEFKEKWKFT